jgi:hypothetical protein
MGTASQGGGAEIAAHRKLYLQRMSSFRGSAVGARVIQPPVNRPLTTYDHRLAAQVAAI